MNFAIFSRIDPLVRLLVLAILLATVLPVRGTAHDIARFVSDAAIFLLFLLNGLRLSRAEVLHGIGNIRLLLPLVLWVFGAMALAGWGAAMALADLVPPAVALGFLYLGTLPSTVQSATAYSSLAGGNVASSVVAAALLNILGVFLTAPLFSAMAGSASAPLSGNALLKVFLVLLLPFLIGQCTQRWARGWVLKNRRVVGWMDRAAIVIAVYVAFSGAVDQGIWGQLSALAWLILTGMVCLLLAFAFLGAWLLGGAMALGRGDRISMLYAGAQKSIAMGAPLAAVLFPPGQAGLILLPVLVYHMLQMVVSTPLALRLRRD